MHQFAQSEHGERIYRLHDEGFEMASSQAEATKFQQELYLYAKQYWQDQHRDRASSKTQQTAKSKYL
jgi:hypothetical protein